MRRFIAFDFLRGMAIISVLFFHMLEVVWDYEAVVAKGFEGTPWPYWIIIILLAFFGQSNVLFVILSGLVNSISIHKQWENFIIQNPTANQKRLMANKILKSQLVRGLFIFIMAYVYDVLLNRLVLNSIKQVPNPIVQSLSGFYTTNVLHAIAWGIVISGVIHTQLLRQEKGREWISKYLLLTGLLIFVLTPFMIMWSRTFPYFYAGWETRSLEWNILYFLINSIFRGVAPLFPFAAFGAIGAMIGCRISNGKITKAYATHWLITSAVVFGGGMLLYLSKVAELHIILNVESGTISYYFIDSIYDIGEKLMVAGGSLVMMLTLLYMIDVEGQGKRFAQSTVSLRRFGLISLTVFSLQWINVGLLMIYHNITNAITDNNTPFLQGNFAAGLYDFRYAAGLTSWQFLFWFLITFAVWHLFLWLWEKMEFKGTFEWLVVKLMATGRKDVGGRLDMSASLYNVESLVENPKSYWSSWVVVALWLVFFVMATLDVALYAMTM